MPFFDISLIQNFAYNGLLVFIRISNHKPYLCSKLFYKMSICKQIIHFTGSNIKSLWVAGDRQPLVYRMLLMKGCNPFGNLTVYNTRVCLTSSRIVHYYCNQFPNLLDRGGEMFLSGWMIHDDKRIIIILM